MASYEVVKESWEETWYLINFPFPSIAMVKIDKSKLFMENCRVSDAISIKSEIIGDEPLEFTNVSMPRWQISLEAHLKNAETVYVFCGILGLLQILKHKQCTWDVLGMCLMMFATNISGK